MNIKFNKKILIYIILLLLVAFLIKFFAPDRLLVFNEEFNTDIFYNKGGWYKWEAEKDQVFINENNNLELIFNFNNEKQPPWTYFLIPGYMPGKEYEFIITVKAFRCVGHIVLYDYTSRKKLYSKRINITDKYRKYSFIKRMPDDNNHQLWLKFYASRYKEPDGKLFIDTINVYRL